jgi:hypothetical protein|tara:strand:- start:976 stop:1113 length:138 start_codon:yes stop_codon:yes gene_type:complete
MQDRVKKHLRLCEVDIQEDLHELDEQGKPGESKEAAEDTKIEVKS